MPWRLDPSAVGVLVLDVQDRLVAAVDEGERVAKKCGDLLKLADLFKMPSFVTEQAREKLGPSAAKLDLHRRNLQPLSKIDFSATEVLPKELPETLLVAGLETHICVRQTVYDLRERGHTVRLVGDAMSSRHLLDHALALTEMRDDGIRMSSLEAIGWELTRGADAVYFRRVLSILK